MSKNKLAIPRLTHFVAMLKENRYPNHPALVREMRMLDIAGAYSITQKTLQRDVAFLRGDYGAPIAYDYQRRGYYLTHQGAEQQSDGQYVFWPQGKDLLSPENYTIFRIPNKEGTNIRRLEQIPLIEIKNAMLWFLKQYHAFSDEDALFRGTGRILGINRLTDQSKNYYSLAYDLLRQEGIIK